MKPHPSLNKVKKIEILQDEQVLLAIKQEALKRDFYKFFKYMWPTVEFSELQEPPYIKFLCEVAQELGEYVIKGEAKPYDLLINIPPGHSKTNIFTIFFMIWLWVNNPHLRLLTFSHTKLAMRNNNKARRVIKSKRFKELFGDLVKIDPNSDNQTRYDNTKGGYRIGFSIGGSITGEHGDVLLVDDACDAKAARMPGGFRIANDVIQKTIPSRAADQDRVPTIMIMQRLGSGDPSEIFTKQNEQFGDVRHICLPATTEFPIYPPELKSLYVDGLLDPFRHKPARLAKLKAKLGSRDYAAQYGQSPIENKGGLIEAEWFGRFDYIQLVNEMIAAGEPVIHDFTIDPADEKETQNKKIDKENKSDYTAICNYILFRKRMYIYDIIAFKKEFRQKCDYVIQYVQENGYTKGSKITIEPTASGRPLISILKSETTFNVVEGKYPVKNKFMRVKMAARAMEAKRVYFRANVTWINEVSVEFQAYPNVPHDDRLDSVAMGVDDLTSNDQKPIVKASSSIH